MADRLRQWATAAIATAMLVQSLLYYFLQICILMVVVFLRKVSNMLKWGSSAEPFNPSLEGLKVLRVQTDPLTPTIRSQYLKKTSPYYISPT